MGGSWRLAEAIEGGAIAGTAPRPFRARSIAIAKLAEIQHPDPVEEPVEAIDHGPRSPEAPTREPSVTRAGLSLPGRAWTIVGAAAAIWALIAALLLLVL